MADGSVEPLSQGVPLWTTTFNGVDKAVPMGIVADAAGDVFVAGVDG